MTRLLPLAALALAVVLGCSGSSAVEPPVLSSDATLASLTVSAGALSPAFDPGTAKYSLAVPYGTTNLRVTPLANDAAALSVGVRQDNLALFAVSRGSASSALAVPALGASSTITVRVTAQDGTRGDYTIALTQSAKLSSDSSLSSLIASAGTLAPAFDPGTFNYQLSVPNGTAQVALTATAHDASAKSIAIRQDAGAFTAVASGAASGALAAPAVGASSTLTVRVTAQDGSTSDYSIALTQALPIAPAAFTIYAIGDSTMADYDPIASPNQAGWGQMFRNFLVGTQAAYVNAAKNGRSSKSYYNEGSWATLVRSKLKSGDYVLIQWAHNDESANGLEGSDGISTAPFGAYQTFLGKYIDETRAAGATPILVTPIVRRYFDSTNTVITPKGAHDLTGVGDPSIPVATDLNYVEAMKQVASQKSVQLVDLTASTKSLVEQYGPTDAKAILYIAADDTHIQPLGATLFAQLAVQGLVAQNILTAYLSPAGDLAVSPATLDFSSVFVGNTANKSVSVAGLSLSPAAGNLMVTAPAGYGVSNSSSGPFTSSAQLAYSGGKLAPTKVYVQFAPAAAQTYAGNLTIAPPTGATKTVALTGIGQPSTAGGTETFATWALTTDESCAATGLASCTAQTYSTMENKSFGVVSTVTFTGAPAPSNTAVERAQIAGGTWPGNETGPAVGRYVQFTATPSPGKLWSIDTISFWAGGGGGNNIGYSAQYSKNADFSGAVVMNASANNTKDQMVFQSYPQTLTLNPGETLYIRFYPWETESTPKTGKYLLLQTLTIHGTAQ